MNPDTAIIYRPEHQTTLQRTFWGTVTAIFWVFYLYLLLPLVTLILWVLGVRNAYTEFHLNRQELDPFLLFTLPAIALVCALVVIIWAEINRKRFQGRDRRHRQADVARAEIAKTLGATAAIEQQLLNAKTTTLQMNEHAQPIALLSSQSAPTTLA